MNESIIATGAPAAIGPYSHAVLVGDMLVTSGQLGIDPSTGTLVEGGIEAQTKRALDNLSTVLAAAEMGFEDVIKTTVFVVDLADFSTVNRIYATRFPKNPPARSCVQVAALPAGGLVEIELMACRDK